MTAMNGEGRRRWSMMGVALLALAVLIATPIWMVVRLADQNDVLSAQQDQLANQQAQLEKLVKAQALLIAKNRELVDKMEAQRIAENSNQAAIDLEVCRKTNFALRTNRDAIAAAEAALINVLRMDPHSGVVADQVAASLPPPPPASATDTDCNADGVLDTNDYAGG